jgi:hypothetical protein
VHYRRALEFFFFVGVKSHGIALKTEERVGLSPPRNRYGYGFGVRDWPLTIGLIERILLVLPV